ncbi:MAG: hypothetical protein PWR20_301 [Bacteroidales bacterium]|nr:hypothetical protein [Bacteroidales bacterium]MDN5328337.1 hypothetical protein [Bacteroidales bacterium]
MKTYRFFSLVAILALMVSACTKEPDRIGTDIIPPSDRLTFGQDTTITLEAYSIIDDSVRTDETSQNILGSYWDPVFGITTASIYTQLRLPFVGHSFGTNPVVDSAILKLAIKGAYGDTTSIQTIKVYELTSDIYYDSIYYSKRNAAYNAVPLASKTMLVRPYDSVYIDTVKYAPHLRIRLDQSAPAFIQKIFSASSDALSTNDEFIKYIKGLYITAEPANAPGTGTLMYINLESALSELVIYYKNDEEDSLSFSLVINSSSARFNNFNHQDYLQANASFKQQVINKDTTLGKEKLYLQAMGGVKIKLQVPELTQLTHNKKIAINDAVLELYNIDNNSTYGAPDKLLLYEESKGGEIKFLTEQNQGDEYFGGTYNSTAGKYFFRIPRYVQGIVDGTRDSTNHLTLQVSGPSVRAYRLVIGGTQPTDPAIYNQRVKLRVVYTILP